jgi:uncharacterized alpha-E superfamily protein
MWLRAMPSEESVTNVKLCITSLVVVVAGHQKKKTRRDTTQHEIQPNTLMATLDAARDNAYFLRELLSSDRKRQMRLLRNVVHLD